MISSMLFFKLPLVLEKMINFSVRARKIENLSYENPTKNISIHRNTHHRKKIKILRSQRRYC